jgi:hypothetical protein
MWSRKFWQQAAERSIKTAAQTAATLLAAGPGASALGVDLLTIDWQTLGSLTASMALLSLLTSIASAGVGPEKGDPSLVG